MLRCQASELDSMRTTNIPTKSQPQARVPQCRTLTGSSASGGPVLPPSVTSGAFGVTTGSGERGLSGVVAGGLGFLYGLVVLPTGGC